jgi:serine/threonine protein phosphatase PrpC
MRNTRAHSAQAFFDETLEISSLNEPAATLSIKKHLSSRYDARVMVTQKGVRGFYVTAEDVSNTPGHGLVYRISIEPGKEEAVESFSGKKNSQNNYLPGAVVGSTRFVGSESRHWIKDSDWPVTLPHLGEIELARRSLLAGPPNPFEARIYRDCCETQFDTAHWQYGQHAASLALGNPTYLRQHINEDALLCRLLPESTEFGSSYLYVVADGMGGHGGGQVAASSVIQTFATADLSEDSVEPLSTELPRRLEGLYRELIERLPSGRTGLVSDNMGAPFAAVRVFDSYFQAIYAGDCCVARYRRQGDQYHCVWSSTVEGWGSRVYNAVGLLNGRARPLSLNQSYEVILPDDYLIVATDGIWKCLSLAGVGQQLSSSGNASDAELRIRAAVESVENENKASDNRALIVYKHHAA